MIQMKHLEETIAVISETVDDFSNEDPDFDIEDDFDDDDDVFEEQEVKDDG